MSHLQSIHKALVVQEIFWNWIILWLKQKITRSKKTHYLKQEHAKWDNSIYNAAHTEPLSFPLCTPNDLSQEVRNALLHFITEETSSVLLSFIYQPVQSLCVCCLSDWWALSLVSELLTSRITLPHVPKTARIQSQTKFNAPAFSNYHFTQIQYREQLIHFSGKEMLENSFDSCQRFFMQVFTLYHSLLHPTV